MKLANKVILVLDGADALATVISGGLLPNVELNCQKVEDSFKLSLEGYGIKDQQASGRIINFISPNGHYEVSVILLQNYEPPVLACALNEVLLKISGEDSSSVPSLIVPFIVPESKFKQENAYPVTGDKNSVCGIKIGPATDLTEALSSRLQKTSPSARVYHEGLALLLHMVNVMKLPTVVMVGQTRTSGKELEVICEIGEHLATVSSLRFLNEKMVQNPTKSTKGSKEAWRELYG